MVSVASAALWASGSVAVRYFSAGISRPLLPPAKALREAWRAWNEENEGFAALSPAPAAGEALGSRTAKRVNIMTFGGGVIRWGNEGWF